MSCVKNRLIATPIILDLSDIAKPLAKKMDYLAKVRDGSIGELVNGYWLVELYASLSRKNPVPVINAEADDLLRKHGAKE